MGQATATISELGANFESFRTWLSTEAHSGAPLFHMAANLRLPGGLSAVKVQAISEEIMVDVAVGRAG